MIKVVGVFRDPPQRLGKLGLPKQLAGLIEISVPLKDLLRGREAGQNLVVHAGGFFVGQNKAIGGKVNRRRHHLRKPETPILFLRMNQARHRTRHSNGAIPDDAGVRNDVAAGVEIHVRGCGQRSFLAVVDKKVLTRMLVDEHEAAATDVACGRMDDSERKSNCDRGVDRIAAGLQNLNPGIGGQMMDSHHHCVRRAHWLIVFEHQRSVASIVSRRILRRR